MKPCWQSCALPRRTRAHERGPPAAAALAAAALAAAALAAAALAAAALAAAALAAAALAAAALAAAALAAAVSMLKIDCVRKAACHCSLESHRTGSVHNWLEYQGNASLQLPAGMPECIERARTHRSS